jgi:hypothetical protein
MNKYYVFNNDLTIQEEVMADKIAFQGRSILLLIKDEIVALYPYKDIYIKLIK